MFYIFLDNAIKYTPKKGTITIGGKKERNNIKIEIKDTGIGIDKKDLPFIFDRFYRADKSRTKKSVPGFGLGLSLAKKIITLHKGQISVKSKRQKGTTFAVKLPLASY